MRRPAPWPPIASHTGVIRCLGSGFCNGRNAHVNASTPTRQAPALALKLGIAGGIIAGTTFALAEMIGSALLGGDLLAPFQAFASVALGTPPPEIPLSTAIPVGLVVHAIFSIGFGLVFAAIWAALPQLRSAAMATLVAGTAFGALLWAVNFYLVAPLIGRPWFAEAPPIPQFVYHAFFYGTVLTIPFVALVRKHDQV